MSLLSSHRLHWGSHHEVTDHFMILIDRMMHDSTSPLPSAAEKSTPAAMDPSSPSTDTVAAQLEILGP